MLVFARPADHDAIQARLRGLLRVPFRFESRGSHIILYQPEVTGEGQVETVHGLPESLSTTSSVR